MNEATINVERMEARTQSGAATFFKPADLEWNKRPESWNDELAEVNRRWDSDPAGFQKLAELSTRKLIGRSHV